MKIRKKYIYIVVALILFTSCEDFLEKEPFHQPVQQNFWQTSEDVESGLNGAYALLRVAFNDKVAYYTYGDVPSDQFSYTGYEDYDNIRMYNLGERLNENSSYRTMVHMRDWTNFYKVINHVNTIIAKTQEISVNEFDSEQDKNNKIGEAYFLRGFTYFYMTRIWGDLPLLTEYIRDPVNQPYVARSPKEEIWDQINSDLTMASDLLTWGYNRGVNNAIRGSKGATLATLAHLHAWQGNYDQVANVTQTLLENGGYALIPGNQYETMFDNPTTENIFEISSQLEDEEEFQEDGEFTIGRKLLKFPYTVREFQVEPEWRFDVNRFRTLFNVQDGETNDSIPDLRLQQVFEDIGSFMPITTKYDNTGFEFPDETRGFYVDNNIIIFRLAGIMLLRAEALAAMGQTSGSIELLDQVRARVGLEPYNGEQELFTAVMEERARELWAEGHRFYDMIRMKREVPTFQFSFINDDDFQAEKYYWPIEPLLRTNDPELEQTEFWRSRI
ncbi:Starch-binding associating with outer membrane [Zunongwangia mangrovi]|uniref:Starch-binding associating with outer membrane n=1 Tax=Zunongwangia mangrovi TaxID=1334022 RepID=A0A1I1L1D5_9FLAO|nr:RagB/SusD family nutrient uptake outer membrane protein [Zunongwangia mangrovi]SFC66854.1 Starch-binding associating with outer membrane [Zunongwangia mangrovi]